MSVEVRSPSATHDLGRLLGGRVPIGFGVGSQGDIWLLLKLADDELAESGQATPYRILQILQGDVRLDVEIDCPSVELELIGPLGDNVLVAARYADPDEPPSGESSAWLYDRAGVLQRELHLGDGICDLQVGRDGTIWMSCEIDECGELSESPSTLIACDERGKRIFVLPKVADNESPSSPNVASDHEVWCIHWTDSTIVQVRDRGTANRWTITHTASALAVDDRNVLLVSPQPRRRFDNSRFEGLDLERIALEGGERYAAVKAMAYAATLELSEAIRKDAEQRANCADCTIGWIRLGDDGKSSYEAEFLLRMPGGAAIRPTMVCGRGDRLFILAGEQLQEVAVGDLVGRLH